MWRVANVIALHDETTTARTITFEVPDWPGHVAGQHVDVRLTASDANTAVRSYSIASAADVDESMITDESRAISKALSGVAVADGANEAEVLGLASAIEADSEHPIAKAIWVGARSRGIEPRAGANFEALL